MNLEQLAYIVEIAKTRSFSAAASQMHMTQSAISQSVRKLEEELDLHVFERSRQGAVPTEAGKQLIEQAIEILQRVDLLRSTIDRSRPLSGSVEVATFPSVMPYLIETTARMKSEHPQLHISIEEKGSMDIVEDVRQGRTHLGFIALYSKQLEQLSGLQFSAMYTGKLVAAAHHESPLAQYQRITPKQLMQHQLALYNDRFVHDFVDRFTDLYGELSILFWTNNSEAVTSVLDNGLAASIGHDFSFHQHSLWKSGHIKIIEIADVGQPDMQIGFLRSEARALGPGAELFATRFRQAIELGHL
ncbi:LysR family transcriptional regulator [Saccharibacillus sp. O16]|nr:LysR family transcriptional regulator [Saccharibacillus sp. O16]